MALKYLLRKALVVGYFRVQRHTFMKLRTPTFQVIRDTKEVMSNYYTIWGRNDTYRDKTYRNFITVSLAMVI
jgi:hypothetical protein